MLSSLLTTNMTVTLPKYGEMIKSAKRIDHDVKKYISTKDGDVGILVSCLGRLVHLLKDAGTFKMNLKENIVECRENEAGIAVIYAVMAINIAEYLYSVEEPLQLMKDRDAIAKTAHRVTSHLNELVSIRISNRSMNIFVEGKELIPGEGMALKFLNTLILLEAILLIQVHMILPVLSDPDELVRHIFSLYAPSDILFILQMPSVVGMTRNELKILAKAIRTISDRSYMAIKDNRIVLLKAASLLETHSNLQDQISFSPPRSNWTTNIIYAVFLVIIYTVLVVYITKMK